MFQNNNIIQEKNKKTEFQRTPTLHYENFLKHNPHLVTLEAFLKKK